MKQCDIKFRIDTDGYLLVSFDKGCTWENLGMVRGDASTVPGPQGEQGPQGPSGQDGTNGADGNTPYINELTGTWWIGTTDTGVLAEGVNGEVDIEGSSDIDVVGTPSVTKRVVGNKTILKFHELKGERGDAPEITAERVEATNSVIFSVDGVPVVTLYDGIHYAAGSHIVITPIDNNHSTIACDLTAGEGITINNNNEICLTLTVPTEKNELIYSDDGETLTTHQLMFTGGLVVDNSDDLDLCKEKADISMSAILSTWTAYGYDSDDKNQWGYCDSTGEGSTQTVTKVGGATQSVPVFKYNGKSQDYIFNTKNTSYNTGYYSPDAVSEFDSTMTCGVIPSLQSGGLQDYMAIVPALTLSNEKGQTNGYNYGISIHVENQSATAYGRTNQSGAGGSNPSTIQIVAWKQGNLNSAVSSGTNIGILTAAQGLTIIPYVSALDNASGSQNLSTSCIQTRTIRKGNIITFYASDPYKVCDGSLTAYNDDYDYKNNIHLDRPVTINLDAYTVTYVKADGTIGVNDFSATGASSNATVREIFDMLKTSAHRGFECESNPGTFFRNCTAHERIIDVTPGEYKVYDYDGSRWDWSFDTRDTTNMPKITVGGTQYTLEASTVAGTAKYKWTNGNTSYYTTHPVPSTSDYAYPTSGAVEADKVAITAVSGKRLLPTEVFENGSRIAWNRITDKLFYNDGASIYRISAVPEYFAGYGLLLGDTEISLDVNVLEDVPTSNAYEIDYNSPKYIRLSVHNDSTTTINVKMLAELTGTKSAHEIVVRIDNVDSSESGPAVIKVAKTAASGVTGTIKNMYDPNVTNGTGISLYNGGSMEMVFTFWNKNDVTFNGGEEVGVL